MPPEERRASLIDAVIPLLREEGPAVSTRQIAQAAGVAEGTIFGVFPDKQTLIHTALLTALDPEPLERDLANIDPSLDIRERFHTIANVMVCHLTKNAPLLTAMRRAAKGVKPGQAEMPGPPPSSFFEGLHDSRQRMLDAMALAMEPHRDQLRMPPNTVAALFLGLLSMNSRAGFSGFEGTSTDDIVALVLDGVLLQPAP